MFGTESVTDSSLILNEKDSHSLRQTAAMNFSSRNRGSFDDKNMKDSVALSDEESDGEGADANLMTSGGIQVKGKSNANGIISEAKLDGYKGGMALSPRSSGALGWRERAEGEWDTGDFDDFEMQLQPRLFLGSKVHSLSFASNVQSMDALLDTRKDNKSSTMSNYSVRSKTSDVVILPPKSKRMITIHVSDHL